MQVSISTGFAPRGDVSWEKDLAFGREAESEFAKTLGPGMAELKRDSRAWLGTHFVEFECRGRPSGISTTDSQYWVLRMPNGAFVVCPIENLRPLVEKARSIGDIKPCLRGSHPTVGAIVNINDMLGIKGRTMA